MLIIHTIHHYCITMDSEDNTLVHVEGLPVVEGLMDNATDPILAQVVDPWFTVRAKHTKTQPRPVC